MKVTIESTDEFGPNGVGRVWRGVSEGGIPCIVLVMGVGTETPEDDLAIRPELETLSGLSQTAIGQGRASDLPGLISRAVRGKA